MADDELANALLSHLPPDFWRDKVLEESQARFRENQFALPNALAGPRREWEMPRWRAPNPLGGDEAVAAQVGDDARRGDWLPAAGGLSAILLGAPAYRGRKVRASPDEFMRDIQSRDIQARPDVSLRWNPERQWFDIVQEGSPIGRSFVTPVNAKTGHTHNPDAFILGPRLDEGFRGQGIGTAVYDAMTAAGEPHGMRLVPGLSVSPEAFQLWRRRDPELLARAMAREGAGGSSLTPEQRDWLATRKPQ